MIFKCDVCFKNADELAQRDDWPGVYEEDGTYRAVLVCSHCLGEEDGTSE